MDNSSKKVPRSVWSENAQCLAIGTLSLVFIADVTADRGNRMNSDVNGAVLSPQIQTNAAEVTVFKVQISNDTKNVSLSKYLWT